MGRVIYCRGCLGRPFPGGIWGSYGALRGGVCRGHVGASTGLNIEHVYWVYIPAKKMETIRVPRVQGLPENPNHQLYEVYLKY